MTADSKESFGERLKRLLDEKDLSLKQVATAIGKSAVAVHKWTRGGEIDHANLLALAKFLQVHWLWLRYGDAVLADLASQLAVGSPAKPGAALRSDREARTATAIRMANIVIWQWNATTGETINSDNTEAVFGRPIRQIIDLLPIVHPEDRPHLEANLHKVRAPGGRYAIEYRIQWPDGTIRWIAGNGYHLDSTSDSDDWIVGTSQDITDRKAAEEAAQANQSRLEVAMHAMQLTIWEHDLNTHRIRAGHHILSEASLSEEETWADFISRVHPEDRVLIDLATQKALTLGTIEQVEFRILDTAGQTHWLASRIKAVADDTGNTQKIIGVTGDISQRKQTELETRNRQHRLELLLAHANLGAWEVNLMTHQVICSDAAAQLLGYRTGADIQVESQLLDRIHPGDRGRVVSARQDAMRNGGRYQLTFRIITADGQEKRVTQYAGLEQNSLGEWSTCYGTIALAD